MKYLSSTAVVLALVLASGGAHAQHGGHGQPSPYSGQEARDIKSLSEADIAELRRGGGWGLAKAAELNGVPGPAHLLELKDEIPLSANETAAIEAIFEKMREEAIKEGERLIARERALDEAFRARNVTEDSLRHMLADIERSRSALRHIHLSAHLETIAIVSEQQVARYNSLRGYGSTPCSNVPAGHDPVIWRKHNRCD